MRVGSRVEGDSRGIRVAFLMRRFPTLSETFILNQITGLIDAGVDLEIFAWEPGGEGEVHPEVEEYGLMHRTHYIRPPRPRFRRLLRTAHLVARGTGWRRPATLVRSLDVLRYGRRASGLSLLYAAASFLQREPHPIVHCQFGQLGLFAMTLREIGALPGRIVVSFRGADLTTRDTDLYKKDLFRAGDLFLPVCDAFRDRLVELECDPRKVHVHRSGIKLDKFQATERTREDGAPTRLLTIARFVEKKGIAFAIRAVARLEASGRSVAYTIVGDGPLREELERLTRDLGIENQVRFLAPRSHDDVLPILYQGHILVQPSVTARNGDQEGIPNVLKEAMATGMPVVGTNHSGIPELIEDGVSGFLVPERDVDALADRLTYLADHPETWPAMGRAGRAKIEAEYDSDRLNEQLVELYRGLALGSGS